MRRAICRDEEAYTLIDETAPQDLGTERPKYTLSGDRLSVGVDVSGALISRVSRI